MAGRPSKYHSHVEPKLLLIEAWARDGLTDADICNNLDVGKDAFIEYKKQYPELTDALKKGKEVIDAMVENALLKAALGYTFDEVTKEGGIETKVVTKEVQPNTTALIFWLKNRKPGQWRDKQEIGIDNDINITVSRRKANSNADS